MNKDYNDFLNAKKEAPEKLNNIILDMVTTLLWMKRLLFL